MNRKEKEAAIRKRFNVPDDEVIPEYVITHISLDPQTPLTGKDMVWAKKVAERFGKSK